MTHSAKPPDYYTAAYPGREEALISIREGRAEGAETVIAFLEEDPYSFGTGYQKERAWRYLRRVPLTESQKQRLRGVALSCVRTRWGRDLLPMARLLNSIADADLRRQVRELTESSDPMTARRARLLEAFLVSLRQGDEYVRQVREQWLPASYGFGSRSQGSGRKPGKPRWTSR